MPQPYRSLLVHNNDMTPTLENYWGDTIHLKVLNVSAQDETLTREVVLVLDTDERRVEFGAINIHLEGFDPEPRRLIEKCYQPLGRILRDHRIPHASRPSAYFQVEADEVMGSALELEEFGALWGRCNVIACPDGRVLAEVVEILPPLEDRSRKR